MFGIYVFGTAQDCELGLQGQEQIPWSAAFVVGPTCPRSEAGWWGGLSLRPL